MIVDHSNITTNDVVWERCELRDGYDILCIRENCGWEGHVDSMWPIVNGTDKAIPYLVWRTFKEHANFSGSMREAKVHII